MVALDGIEHVVRRLTDHRWWRAAASFDGFHQQDVATDAPPHASQHGRRNSSLRALWEVHPVYSVTPPG